MIIGIGNDIVDTRRIESMLKCHGKRFEERCFTSFEQEKARARRAAGHEAHTYAKRFAAKEACVKALGTGFAEDVYMKDIGVIDGENGRPILDLSGGALKKLETITPENMQIRLHLSLSDEPPYAQAFVVIEAYAI